MAGKGPNLPNRGPEGEGGGPPSPQRPKTLLIWLILGAAFVFLLIHLTQRTGDGGKDAPDMTAFKEQLDQGHVESVTQDGDVLVYKLRPRQGPAVSPDAQRVDFPARHYDVIVREVFAYNQKVDEHNKAEQEKPKAQQKLKQRVKLAWKAPSKLWAALALFGPWVLIMVFVWFFFFRPMRAPGSGVLSFGKSRARLLSKERTGVTFDDVAGIEEAKEDVKEIIEFLKDPERFRRLGGRIPRGVLLVGAPGTGKTLLARAIAGEASRPFFSISGSDFVEMFVGVGASRVRDLFRQAKEKSPCIIFLDEVDAVGRRRGTGLGGGHDEREQTLNAILVEMDGFETDENVILIAATNRPDVLDPALLRPGRFDRQIVVDLPDIKGREAILRVHARGCTFVDNVDFERIARGTPGFSGADLENLINESAIIAVMKDKDAVELDDLEEARDKVMWGRQKRSRVMAEEERRAIAYHESGHALVAKSLPDAEPLHKVTIVPRGSALGATMSLPKRDTYLMRRNRVLADITVLMGGRVSEELFCSDISSGAQNDFHRATDLARLMVCKWGMSEQMGPISYTETEEHFFLGREIARMKSLSEETAVQIDREIKSIIQQCYQRAKDILSDRRDTVEQVVEALLKLEVLSTEQVDRVIAGQPLSDETPSEKAAEPPEQAGDPQQTEDPPAAAPESV